MIDYRQTHRTLQRTLESIEQSAEATTTLSGILEAIVQGPGPSLGITGGRLYRREGDAFILEASTGSSQNLRPGFAVPADYLPIQRLLEEGLVIVDEGDPGFDPRIERHIGVHRFAAIAIGEDDNHLIAFSLGDEVDAQQAVYLLGTIRHVINLQLITGQLMQDVAEARRIQLSLLPERPPAFQDYDIAARSIPAEAVGGDIFDFPLVSKDTLGLAIADSCGHGVPAALMARDVVTGMRVALDVHYRAVRAIEKVNRVVSRSALASRFISMFYAEIDATGTMLHVNAGHPPGLFWRDGRIKRLATGGVVMGVDPRATYVRDFETFSPGSMLVLYTDGLIEARDAEDRFFGIEGLEDLLRRYHDVPAAEFVDIVFRELDRRAAGEREDDQTLLVVRRPAV